MKVRLLSDLHTEGYEFVYRYLGEDVLVLAGDIFAKNPINLAQIVKRVPNHVDIIFVAGNHEYYKADFNEINAYLKNANLHPNFHFLKNDHITIGDYAFFGGTMFTDFDMNGLHDQWFAEMAARKGVNDFFVITIDGRRWTTMDHRNEHELFNREFDRWVKDAEGKTRVCVTHFVPTKQCLDPQFKGNTLNPYFIAAQEERIAKVDYWLFGHTHTAFDVMQGDTRLVCNPRGYGGGKENLNFNPNLILEI